MDVKRLHWISFGNTEFKDGESAASMTALSVRKSQLMEGRYIYFLLIRVS